MNATRMSLPRARAWDSDNALLFSLSNTALLVCLTVLYSGALRYLGHISSLLLYSFYVLLFGCMALSLLTARGRVEFRWLSVLPYMGWLAGYMLWGTLFSPDQDAVLREMMRYGFRNALVLSIIVVALVNRHSLYRFAAFVQVAVIVNAGFSLWLAFNPMRMLQLALYLDPTAAAYSERPGGLWINPNEASFAFLFGLILSHWVRGKWVWVARVAALLGIFLSASRTGFLLAGMCVVVFVVYYFRNSHPQARAAVVILLAGLLVAARVGWLQQSLAPLNIEVGQQTALERLTDLSESTTTVGSGVTRRELTLLGLARLVEAPWYGNGFLSFQGGESAARVGLQRGVHNIYVAVGGEAGWLVLLLFLGLLTLGIVRTIRAQVLAGEKLVLYLFWVCYLLIGLVWHNQLTSVAGAVYAGLLFHVPYMLDKEGIPGSTALTPDAGTSKASGARS